MKLILMPSAMTAIIADNDFGHRLHGYDRLILNTKGEGMDRYGTKNKN
jgi:hypothetical protein